MKLNNIAELIEDIRQGKMVILMDDEDRENEGDLVMAAEKVTAADINFMIRYARGLVCLPMSREHCERLKLPLMTDKNKTRHSTNFTVSIEAAAGVSTGISAADRAHTIQTAVSPNVKAEDIIQPGHVFPIMAQPGGVLSRAGHTEAACDLSRLAGLSAAGVIVEIMNDDGTMARRPDLEKFAEQHNLKIGTIADLIHYRTLNEKTITRLHENTLQTDYGTFNLITYQDSINSDIHLALVKGSITPEKPTLVRVHVADTLRDLLQVKLPNIKNWNLHRALSRLSQEESGVLVLLSTPSSNQDLLQKIEQLVSNPNNVRQEKTDNHPHQYRTVGTGSQILRDLGVKKMRVLSSVIKFSAISGFGLEVVEYVACE